MARTRELAGRSTVRSFQCEGHILICADGDLPNPGFEVDIEQSPLRILPPQYNLVQCRRPGVFPEAVTPYRICRTFPLAESVPEITVHHVDGSDRLKVAPCDQGLSVYEESCSYGDDAHEGVPATGRSTSLSFDDAFADAVAQLPPPPVADGLTRVTVTEIGGLFGGIAGFHELFVKIRARIDGIT